MKVYLEEKDMPKSCENCQFTRINLGGFNVCKFSEKRIKADSELDIKFCPLQSLSNYTKQVRKEICDKIRENAISHNNLEVDMYYITPQQLYEIEKGENNG